MTGRRRSAENRGGPLVVMVLVALLAMALGGYATLCWIAGDRVPEGATVEGIGIGGLSQNAAENRLHHALADQAERQLPVSAVGRDYTVDPERAGIRLDVPTSVRRAGGGNSIAPGRIWDYFTAGEDLPASRTVDRKRLARAVTGLAGSIDREPVQGAVRFVRGAPVATAPRNGVELRRGAAARALGEGFLSGRTTKLPVSVQRPTVQAGAVADGMAFARKAVRGPVTLSLNGYPVRATPRLYTRAITLAPKGGRLVPTLDADRLLEVLEPVMRGVAGTPVPATFRIEDGRPVVVPSKVGVTFSKADLRRKFLRAVVAEPGRRSVRIQGVTAQPSLTTAQARRLGVKEQVGSFTSRFGYAAYRNTNIARGAAAVDATLLLPGDAFSFRKTTGPPSRQRGFTPGHENVAGVFRPDPGGGLSQLSSTLYNAAFAAGLRLDRHRAVGSFSPRFPKGRVADVHGGADLRLRNDSGHGVFVTASTRPSARDADGSVTVTLWSTKRWEIKARTSPERNRTRPRVIQKTGGSCGATVGTPGFSVKVVREFRKPGQKKLHHSEASSTTYPPSDSVVCAAP